MLHVADGLDLPDEVVTSSNAILAVKRAGKSNAAVVMAEAMSDAGQPWCAIDPKGDWWGVRSNGDGTGPGLPVVIFGGLHGDLPLEPGAGAFVADLVAEQRLTCVLDVSEFSKGEQIKFLTPFAERLLRVNRDPLHLFLEEADEYLPQRVGPDEARLVGAIGKLVRRGGFRGVGTTLITQRSAVVNKDVLTQTETLYVLRTTSPQDRKAVKDWLEHQGAPDELMASLPSLGNGEAWVVSPHVLGIEPTRVQFHRRRTFDSGATPKPGERRRQPTSLADVDLVAVKEAMAESIERAKATDPKLLQKRITELARELDVAKALRQPEAAEAEVVEVTVEVPPAGLDDLLRATLDDVDAAIRQLQTRREELGEWWATMPRLRTEVARETKAPAPRPRPAPARPAPADDGTDLTPYAEHLLATLAKRHPVPMTARQWSVAADRMMTSSAWPPAVRLLLRVGFVMRDGDDFVATDNGLAHAGVDPGTPPPSGADLVDWWCERIPGPAQTALRILATHRELTVDEVADEAGWSRTSSGPGAAVSTLVKLGLAQRSDGVVRVDPSLT